MSYIRFKNYLIKDEAYYTKLGTECVDTGEEWWSDFIMYLKSEGHYQKLVDFIDEEEFCESLAQYFFDWGGENLIEVEEDEFDR